MTVPPDRQCILPTCDGEAVDPLRDGALCESHLDGDGDGEPVTEADESPGSEPAESIPQESDTGDERTVAKRAAYLARTTDLRETVAEGLAYRELGYSHSGIARQCNVVEATVESWMGRVVAQYGPRAVETKLIDERGALEPVTPDDVRALSDVRGRFDSPSEREQWLAIADANRQYVPSDVKLDSIAEINGGEGR